MKRTPVATLLGFCLLAAACGSGSSGEPAAGPAAAATPTAGQHDLTPEPNPSAPAGDSSTGADQPPAAPTPDDTDPPTPTATTEADHPPAIDGGDHRALVCWAAPTDGAAGPLSFVDETTGFGLDEPLRGMHAHAAAFGDVDDDGLVDLVVGTFADRPVENYALRGADGPAPDRLLLGDGAEFAATTDLDGALGRTSGAVFADLDLDGDLDLVLARNPRTNERQRLPSSVYENDGGRLDPVEGDGIDPTLGGRSIGVLDADRDGLPDLFVLEDRWAGGSSRLYLNRGDLRFSDATGELGLPLDVHGLGVVTVDLNADGMADVFVGGSNRLFVGGERGFTEADSSVFVWDLPGNEDDVAGVDAADVNRDGRPDLIVGQHFNSTVDDDRTEPVRLYLNTTVAAGDAPTFVDVTRAAGLVGLPTKAPHVEFADLDNDGWPDIVTSASAEGGTRAAVFRHLGIDPEGMPTFSAPTGLGSDQYWVSAPVADVDRDGRLDLLLVEWEPALGSVLAMNRSRTGHWIEVSVDASLGGGPGTLVSVYEPGHAGHPEALVAQREISASAGYSAGHEATVHVGVGGRVEVDVIVAAPGEPAVTLSGVAVDRHIRLPAGCSP
ncbi:MAG: CRTAC1 family protein [Acidimicrobiales bacterium]